MSCNLWRLTVGGVTALAFVGVALLGAAPAALHADTPALGTPAQDPPAARRVVRMSAERFLFTPSEITVEEGTVLEIRLTSDDTDHGFRIIGSTIDVSIPKRNRGEAIAVFAAAKPGDYTFECSHMCGAGHGFMRGRIRVKARAAGPAKKTGDPR